MVELGDLWNSYHEIPRLRDQCGLERVNTCDRWREEGTVTAEMDRASFGVLEETQGSVRGNADRSWCSQVCGRRRTFLCVISRVPQHKGRCTGCFVGGKGCLGSRASFSREIS